MSPKGCARPGALRACPFAGRGTSADSFILSRRDRVHPAEELPSRFVVYSSSVSQLLSWIVFSTVRSSLDISSTSFWSLLTFTVLRILISDRVARAAKEYGLPEASAEKTVECNDKIRAKHYQYYAGAKWGEARHYHLTVNSSAFGVEAVARSIVGAAKAFA